MVPEFKKSHSLRDQNSLGVPSVCDAYIEIADAAELPAIIDYANQNRLRIFVLGSGTNLVLRENLSGLVVKPNIFGRQRLKEDRDQIWLRIGAGEDWHSLVTWCLQQGYYGLENLALIPGSCGAAPVQNIGAYGVEISRFITAVECVDLASGNASRLSNQQCRFGYRDSIFKHELDNRCLISHIEICLSKSASINKSYPALSDYLEQHDLPETAESIYRAVCDIRRSKLPDIKEIPNAGSFFKNPLISEQHYQRLRQKYPEMPGYLQPTDTPEVKVPAGWLIDKLGWKGVLKEGVGVHEKQALVIVNPGHCSGQRVLAFAEQLSNKVKDEFKISLEIEPRIIGGS